jgi:transposase
MKKNSTGPQVAAKLTKTKLRELWERARLERFTIGLDLGDGEIQVCVLNAAAMVVVEDQVGTTKTALNAVFEKMPPTRVVMEAGTHSPWASRHLTRLGHEVIVANPRKVALIKDSRRKNDRIDAEKLARLGRLDPRLLSPIEHREEEAQRDLAHIRTRDVLVRMRTMAVNSARGQVKALGLRLDSCDTDQVDADLVEELPEEIRALAQPLVETAALLTAQIQAADQRIHEIAKRYPEIALLTAIYGVGELTALTFVLTIENAERFGKSREVGPYLYGVFAGAGMTPGQAQSGESDPHQPITKEGDRMLRWLLVQCAHTILRHGAPDSDLRRWGLAKMEERNAEGAKGTGKKSTGKKKVLVAVARKLAVVMHRLWSHGEVYDPLYAAGQRSKASSVAA